MKKPTVDYDDIEIEELPDDDPDTSYLEQEGFEDRLRAYKRGDFYFIGLRATVEVEIAGVNQTITSGGLWGIEDDSGRAYLNEVADEERAQLVDILEEMNVAVRGAPKR